MPQAVTTTRAGTWVLAIAAIAGFMATLDTIVVSTALSTIRLDLHAQVDQLEWTINAYNLSFAVMLMTAAALGDRYGRRRFFVLGIGLFVAASAACALAPSINALIAARAVQGIGAAFVMTLAFVLVSAAFAPERRGSALGIFFAVNGLAVASGPLIGGAIVQSLDWHWIFWLNVPIGLALIPVAIAAIPESFGPPSRVDAPGLVLVTAGVLGLVWGLVRGNIAGWGSPEVVSSLVAGAVLVAAFVWWQRRAREPMIPLRFFRARAFAAGNVAVFFTVASLFTGVFFISQFLQTVLGSGPLQAGLHMLPWTATLFFTAPVAGMLVDRIGERPFMIAGPLLQGVGMGWIALIASPDMAYSAMIAPLIVAGVGVSMSFPAAQNAVVGTVSYDEIGKAAGVNSTMRELGGVFGIAISVAVFTGAGSYVSPAAFSDGFVAAMFVSTALSLLAACAGVALPSRRPAGVPAQAQEAT